MLAKILAATLIGLECAQVEVEVDPADGLPSFVNVGLPDTAGQEARVRVRAAIRNAGFSSLPGALHAGVVGRMSHPPV